MNKDLRVGMNGQNRPTMQAIWRCATELQPFVTIFLDVQDRLGLPSRYMDEREYIKIKADIEADCQRKLEALETVWSLYKGKPSADVTNRLPPSSLTAVVRQAMPSLGEKFSIWEIQKQMEKLFPAIHYKKNSLSGTLTRMHQRKEIEIVRKGEGTAPAVYKRGTSFHLPPVEESDKEP